MSLQLPTQFDSTLGIEFVGGVVATALYGIATSQAVVFFLTFPHESTTVKCSVAFVWAAATIHTLFVAHGLYTSMVSQFTQAVAAILVPWSYWVGFAVGVTGDTIVFCISTLETESSKYPCRLSLGYHYNRILAHVHRLSNPWFHQDSRFLWSTT